MRDLAPGGAQGAAQPDFLAAVQHRDDHDVGDADRADEQGDRAQAEEQGVERAGHHDPCPLFAAPWNPALLSCACDWQVLNADW